MNYIVFLFSFFCFCSQAQGKQGEEIVLPQFDPSVTQKPIEEKGPETSCGYTFINSDYPNGIRTKCPDPGPTQLFKNDDNRNSIYSQDLMQKFQQQNF